MRWSDIVKKAPASPTESEPCVHGAELAEQDPNTQPEQKNMTETLHKLSELDLRGSEHFERCCVLDTGGFLNAHEIHKLADKFYTIPEVIAEIKDARHRHMLDNLTFELTVRSPDLKYYKLILEETHETGDIGFLSETDLRVIALAKQLSDELSGEDAVSWDECADGALDSNNFATDEWITTDNIHSLPDALPVKCKTQAEEDKVKAQPTVSNFAALDASSITEPHVQHKKVVSCFTTDFTVQNALIQLGITAIGVEGRQIKHVKTWVLRCHACFTLVTDTTRQFCPACGSGNTLKRVSYSVDAETGEKKIWINPNHRINTRGLRYNLPKPRWGAHGTNRTLVLREDQLRDFGVDKQTRNKTRLRELRKGLEASDEFGDKAMQTQGHRPLERSSYKTYNVNERRKLMASRRK